MLIPIPNIDSNSYRKIPTANIQYHTTLVVVCHRITGMIADASSHLAESLMVIVTY